MKTTEWQKACKEDGDIPSATFYRLRKELVDKKKIFLSKIDKKWSRKP